jgi:zinc transporter 2
MSNEDAARRQNVLRKLYQATALCSCFFVVEVAGGLISHSLAVLSDAAHLLADLTSFAVAIAASYLASLPATQQHTFGLKRVESLAALFSMVSLALLSCGLLYSAIRRLLDPPEEAVDGTIMSGIAAIGVCVNVVLAVVLGEDHVHMPGAHDHDHSHSHGHCDHDQEEGQASHSHDNHDNYQKASPHSHGHHDHGSCGHETDKLIQDTFLPPSHSANFDELHVDEVPPVVRTHQQNVNLRAAYLHVMADLAQSVAVLIAGLIIWVRPDWHVIDPILTLGFCILVLYSTIGVLRSSISVLLEEMPPNISWQQVYDAIAKTPNVTDVHDLHIWSISHGQPALSVHCTSMDPNALSNIHNVCVRFGLVHSTIQIQTPEEPCITCNDEPNCMDSQMI